jgi:peptidoglycan L-alanyl-D-glutamate endopeptidase CwlK
MDARSEAALATVNPMLADKVRAAASTLEPLGTFLLVLSGLRTAAEQDTLYAQGRTTRGHIVSKAKAGHSMHNYGLAVDVVPFLSEGSGPLNWKPETQQYKAMVRAMKKQGLVWGGDWVSFPDADHFQLAGIPNSPNAAMRRDYGDGGQAALQAIWSNAADGKYNV